MIIGQCAHKYKIQQYITLLDTFRVQSFLSVLPSELLVGCSVCVVTFVSMFNSGDVLETFVGVVNAARLCQPTIVRSSQRSCGLLTPYMTSRIEM